MEAPSTAYGLGAVSVPIEVAVVVVLAVLVAVVVTVAWVVVVAVVVGRVVFFAFVDPLKKVVGCPLPVMELPAIRSGTVKTPRTIANSVNAGTPGTFLAVAVTVRIGRRRPSETSASELRFQGGAAREQ
jgi:hypothetical protein